MTQPLYVFDMDETLINGDCAMIWNEFLVEKGIVTDPDFLDEDKRLMALYSRGLMDMRRLFVLFNAAIENNTKRKNSATYS